MLVVEVAVTVLSDLSFDDAEVVSSLFAEDLPDFLCEDEASVVSSSASFSSSDAELSYAEVADVSAAFSSAAAEEDLPADLSLMSVPQDDTDNIIVNEAMRAMSFLVSI